MKRQILTVIFAIGIGSLSGSAQVRDLVFTNRAEQELFYRWDTTKTIDRDILECLLLAEGMPDQLSRNREWLASLEEEVKDIVRLEDSPLSKGEKLYAFVHERVLRKYSGVASAASLMTIGEYSCVTSTALYYHLGRVVGLPVIFHATPFHVCPVIEHEGKRIWVELTQPRDGFDIEFHQDELVEWLLEQKLATEEELQQKGEDIVYNDFIHGHYQSSVAAILGYHYYNFALKLYELGKREESFWALAKASTLEGQDKMIEEVFDESFRILSSLPRISTSYSKASSTYFKLRGRDTTVVVDGLTSVREGVENLLQTQRDLEQADSVQWMLERVLPKSPLVERPLAELRQFISVNKGLELNRKGRYHESFNVISGELEKDITNGKLQDIYVTVGMAYVQKLLMNGDDELAIATMDSMRKKVPEYAELRDAYSRILVSSIMTSGKYRTSPLKARESLMKAFEMDSTNMYVRESLGAVHHELAMSEIRKSKWQSARRFVTQGLRFAPGNEVLRSDLELLEKELRKSKK